MANNMNMGSANIVTGIPERVGLPMEAIKEVGTILTQRYWQNKQVYSQINTALKNMPTIADEVDKPILTEKSKYIDDTFKRVIDTDNFHNATDVVMEVSQNLSTDEQLRALSSNAATFSQAREEYKVRMNEKGNEALRMYEDDYARLIKEQYIKQGGSVDSNGKAQGIAIFSPKTNLNLDEETQRIEELVTKIPATIRDTFGNVEGISQQDLATIDDPEVRAILSRMPTSETKTTIKTRDIPTIREAVINYLSTDADFKTKIQEITFINHYKNKGRTEVLPEDLKEVINNIGTVPSDILIELSPLYNSELDKLKAKYASGMESKNIATRNKATSNFNKEFTALHHNEVIKEDAISQLNNAPTEDITELYFNTLQGGLADRVVSSGDKYAISEITRDKHRFNTDAFLSAFLRQKKDVGDTRIAMNDNMSLSLPIESLITTTGSEMNKEYTQVKITYDNMIASLKDPKTANKYTSQQQADISAKWQHLKSVYDSTQKNIYLNYSNLEESDKKDIKNTVKNILTKHYYANKPTSTTREQFSITPSSRLSDNDRNISFGIVSSISEDDLISLSPVELLQKNITHARAYNQLSNEGKKEIMSVIRKAQGEASRKIVRTAETKGSITVPITYTSMLNEKTPSYHALKENIASSLVAGNLVNAFSNTAITEKSLGKDTNRPLKGITYDDLDMNQMELKFVNSNNSLPPGNYIEITVPVRGTDTSGQYKKDTPQQYRQFVVAYNGNDELYKSVVTEMANIASKSLNNPVSYNEASTTIINQVKALGSNEFIRTAPNETSTRNVGHIINELKLESGRYSRNLYFPTDTKNQYHKMVIHREDADSPVMITFTNPDGTRTKGYPTDIPLYNIENLSALIGINSSWGFNESVRAVTLQSIMKSDLY